MAFTATDGFEPSRHVKRYLTRAEGLDAEQTYRSRKSRLKHYEQWLRAEGIDIMDVDALTIEDYIINQSGDYAPGTINKRYYAVKKFYDFLADKLDLMDETPFEDVDKKDLNRVMKGVKKVEATREDVSYLTPEQVSELAENVETPRFRNELLIRLMFQSGVREGELVGIRLEDIDRDNRAIKIHAEKTQKNRIVYYQPSLDFLLNQWIDGGERASYPPAGSSPYLLLSRQNPTLEKQRVNKIVKKAAENAGMQETMYVDAKGHDRKKITSHVLRHSHAVQAIESGIDIKTLALHMGHIDEDGGANINMTEKYLRVGDDTVRRAFERFGG